MAGPAGLGWWLGVLTGHLRLRCPWVTAAKTALKATRKLEIQVDELEASVAHAVSQDATLASFQPQEDVRGRNAGASKSRPQARASRSPRSGNASAL